MMILFGILAVAGLALLIIFYYLYSQAKETEAKLHFRLYAVFAFIGLCLFSISVSQILGSYATTAMPNYGIYLVLALDFVMLLLGSWFILVPAFRKDEEKEVKKTITPSGTRVVSQSKAKKTKHKGNSMKPGSSKRRLTRM